MCLSKKRERENNAKSQTNFHKRPNQFKRETTISILELMKPSHIMLQ